jgi:hypothetical protein
MAALGCRSFAVDAAVIFTELQYNPAAGDTEWIELHSLSGVDIDIGGWRLTAGVEYTFAEGTKMPGHGFLVVAANPGAPTLAGIGALGPWSGALSNGGERVRLVNRDGREMDVIDYNDGGDWPAGADGSGATLARRNCETAASEPANWTSSADTGGTPGRKNFAVAGQSATVTSLSQLNSSWKYFIGTPVAGWELPLFDDTSWASAPSALYSGSPALGGGSDGLLGYWPLDETSGTSAANLGSSGAAATLVNSPQWINDAIRGRCILFQGTNQYVDAGSAIIPQMTLTNDFTWSFWAQSAEAASTDIIIGNRYAPSPGGTDWSPREFIKFTPLEFEFHRNATGEGINYADIGSSATWTHHAVVKSGSLLTYYRDGVVGGTRTITQGLNNPQPLYFGGEKVDEYWAGRLDDVAIWTKALTATQVSTLTSGAATPLNVSAAATLATQLGASSTYAFRRSFVFTGTPSRTTLTLKLLMEDGCTVWLNGTQVCSQNNPPVAGTGTANLSADIPIPNTALVRGNNVLAVQVATFDGDPDMVFAAQLTASEQAPVPTDASPGLVFSEISPAGPGFQLELTNISGGAIDLTGYVLRSSAGASANLSGMINAGGFLVLNATQLGFTPVDGDKLFLYSPGGAEVLDAREVTNRLRARSPQFPGRWLFPNAATFGSANSFTFNTDVVINEVMYDQRPLTQSPFAEDPEQWVEIYNRGAVAADLSGWRFSEGMDYVFPAGTNLPPGGYLVISNNAAALQSKWPAVASKIVGNFGGNIRRGGELLRLTDAFGNPVNEVAFGNDAPWPIDAHGGGSSLELKDARADNGRPQTWAASNEAYRGSWQTYTFETLATPSVSNDPTVWNEFIFGLLERGSMMIDDISVIEAPTGVNRQLIQNGTFDTSTTGWRFLGTHSRASVIADPFGTGQVLRVDATEAAEHMHNHAETMLKSAGSEVTINSALTYRISFRARWISGSNLLNTRLYFNRIARTTALPVAPGGGTPGAVNSTAVANLGPTFSGLTHSPAVPPVGQSATVTVTAADPDGLGAVSLFYSVNGGGFVSAAMSNQGGGRYSGTIPAQAGGTKVQFYVQASDTLGAIGTAPALGMNSRAMIQWEDGQARLTLNNVMPNNLRIVMTPADVNKLHTLTNVMSNDRLPCTVIWNEREIYYDCGVHLHGSERGRDEPLRVSFNVRFPADQLLLGAHDSVVIDRSGAGDQFSQREILIKRAITRAGGIPGSEDDICRVIAPQSTHTGPAILGRQRVVNGEYLESAYADGDNGDLFKYELIYHPLTTTGVTGNRGNPENLKFPEPDNVAGVGVNGLGTDKEAYRWHWLIANLEEADDYSRLMTFLNAFGRTADSQYFADTNAMMDVSEWLRSFAVEVLFGIGDNYASGAQHNLYVYRRPADGKWVMFPYDMDFTFTNATTSSLFPNNDLTKLTQNAANRRTYWSHIYELCQTSFNATYLTPWAVHYNNFVSESLTQYMTYVNDRRSFALSQLNSAIPPIPFNITTPDGSSPGPTMTINGTAWVDVKEMRLAGSTQPLAITWTGTQTWQTTVTIAPGPNAITINAFNALGAQVGTDTVNITGTGTLVPATAANLVISEIMYHPGPPNTAEINAGFTDPEAFEFIELMNISPTDFITLAGVRFTMGVAFNFSNVTMAPGARALLVGNQAAFTQRYGNGLTILGQYQPTKFLANNGDRVQLLDAQGQVIRDFSYDDNAPWPESADGVGFSLVLINPASNPDHSIAGNWRSSVALNGNPGGSDATTFAGNPNGDDNGDGINNLTQYALAGATPFEHPFTGDGNGFLTLRFRRNLAADDIIYSVERSLDLQAWTGGTDVAYVSETHLLDGTAEFTWRSTHPIGEMAREFLRLRITKP